MDLTNFYISLSIMWKGMLGIFTVMIIIAIIIWILSKLFSAQEKI